MKETESKCFYSNLPYYPLQDSALFSFLHELGENPDSGVTAAVVLHHVKEAILDGKHFDERNSSIILCQRSQELENIFGMKALHVCQVQDALVKSMVALDSSENSSDSDQELKSDASEAKSTKSTASETNPDTKYRLSDKLKQLFVSAALGTTQELFTLNEALGFFSTYIISRKNHIFDSRNIFVALVGEDPLGDTFNVTAFHRSQAAVLLKNHLIPAQ